MEEACELVQQRQFPQIGEGWFLVFRDKPQSEILLETIAQNAGDITDIQEALADLATLLTEA